MITEKGMLNLKQLIETSADGTGNRNIPPEALKKMYDSIADDYLVLAPFYDGKAKLFSMLFEISF
jgi:hypothetical protein